MKITYSNDTIQFFGGLNFITNEFNNFKLEELITQHLGSRSIFSTFSYSGVIKNLWAITFAGGYCAEDIQSNLKNELHQVEGLNVCSADAILRLQKELSLEKELHLSNANIKNEFSKHELLNTLNLDMLIQCKTLQSSKSYDFDFDNQFIPCEKYDSKKGYKMKHGYFPSIATIGKHIVYFENRNGNCNVKFKQSETLQRAYDLIKSRGITIDRSRMDCGSFTKDVLQTVEQNTNRFYIRAQRCAELSEQIKLITKWETVRIGLFDVEVCEIEYAPFGEEKTYRYVVSREGNKTGQTDVFTSDRFIYRSIATNDRVTSKKDVIEYYNQRGASETIFDEMNNDFGWKNLPFSFLQENTVYMILMAMCRNFYLIILEKFSQKINFLQNTFRLKKFIFRFITLPYKWITRGRQKTLKLFTDKPYNLLFN